MPKQHKYGSLSYAKVPSSTLGWDNLFLFLVDSQLLIVDVIFASWMDRADHVSAQIECANVPSSRACK